MEQLVAPRVQERERLGEGGGQVLTVIESGAPETADGAAASGAVLGGGHGRSNVAHRAYCCTWPPHWSSTVVDRVFVIDFASSQMWVFFHWGLTDDRLQQGCTPTWNCRGRARSGTSIACMSSFSLTALAWTAPPVAHGTTWSAQPAPQIYESRPRANPEPFYSNITLCPCIGHRIHTPGPAEPASDNVSAVTRIPPTPLNPAS